MEQAERASIHVVAGDDMIACLKKMQQRVFGGHTASKRQSVASVIERGQARFEGSARRIGGARIVEALVNADFGLGIGTRLVDRDDHGTGRRVRFLAHVDGPCGKAVGVRRAFRVHQWLCLGRRLCWATNSSRSSLVIMPTGWSWSVTTSAGA